MNTLIVLQVTTGQPTDWVLFLGHFHPLIVHLPIGLLLIAGLLELDRLIRHNSVSPHTIRLILFWSAVSATLACVFGYMLSLGGGYEVETLDSHKWQGIGVALFAWIAWGLTYEKLDRIFPFASKMYLPVLAVALVLLLAAGHQGGNLTHGSDYLAQYIPGSLRMLAGLPPKLPELKVVPITDVNQAMVYQQIVNPILHSRCVQCHNAEKSKAGLRLDSPEMIRKGSEDGPVFEAGKGTASNLIKVCLLPEEDEHHMPPKGKTQLQKGQIALLTWWIDQGAPFDKKVSDVKINDAIRPVLVSLGGGGLLETGGSKVATGRNDRSPAPESPVLTMKVPVADPKVVEELKKTGLLVRPLSKEQNQLEISAVNVRSFTDSQVAMLANLSHQLVWLKLGDTDVSDAAMRQVATFKNLQKLHLEHTRITDVGLKYLKSLPNLEYLNVYGTTVSDAGLSELKNVKNLKKVYLWQTNVTAAGLTKLTLQMPQLEVVGGIDEQAMAGFAKKPAETRSDNTQKK